MTLSFGTMLRGLRQRQGIAQQQLAEQTGISVRTLKYWEAGARHPRRNELQNVLTHLQITQPERAALAALALLPAEERSAERTVSPSLSPSSPSSSSPLLQTGPDALALPVSDLLWALRSRKGWTQEHLADEFGLQRLTVVRWEGGDNLPSGEMVARLGARLCVSLEERRMLWNAHLSGVVGQPCSLEACRAQVECIVRESTLANAPLYELSVLPLQRRLHRHTKETEEAVRLLARMEMQYSCWLYYQERPSESRLQINRALQRVRYRFTPEPYWLHALNLASANVRRFSGETASLEYLLRWLPQVPAPAMQTHLLADCAVTALLTHDNERATALIKEAHRVRPVNMNAETEAYLWLSTARIRLATRGDGDDWETVIEQTQRPSDRLHCLLIGASSAVLAGAQRSAQDYMGRAGSLLNAEMSPILSQRFREQERELEGSAVK
jgi:transcriptional regulator with XRE-family HTH domain